MGHFHSISVSKYSVIIVYHSHALPLYKPTTENNNAIWLFFSSILWERTMFPPRINPCDKLRPARPTDPLDKKK